MIPEVDLYLQEGCGRCPLGGTPDCKVHSWTEELTQLRLIINDCNLTEELKWSIPCYTWQGNNILTLSALKGYVGVGFFKGVLIEGQEEVLEKPGPNSQSARLIKFTSVNQIIELEPVLRDCIQQAIEIEKKGLKVEFKQNPEPIPEELQQALDEDPALNQAFESLTPGRQRSYILHIGGAKQAKTRISRVEKCTSRIFEGKGFHEY